MQSTLNQRARSGLRLAVLAAAALACGGVAAQKIDDTPPAVQNNVPPNFMFMIDNSGSMSNIVLGAPYNPATVYTTCAASKTLATSTEVNLNIQSGGNPRIVQGSTTVRHTSFDSTNGRCFGTTSVYDAKLLADTGSGTKTPGSYLPAQYTGNYLNWYFGNFNGVAASGWVDRRPGTQTRMEVAKASTKTAMNNLPLPSASGKFAVRVGLSTYRSTSDGGWVRALIQDFNATVRTSINTTIDGLTPQSSTPLASTLADLGRYIAMSTDQNIVITPRTYATPQTVKIDTALKLDSRNACPAGPSGALTCTLTSQPTTAQPIQAWCQRSSIFLVTDGRPQGDKVFTNNVYLRDYDGDCSGTNASRCDGNPDVNNGASGNLAGWDRKEIGVAGRNGYAYSYEQNGSDYMDDIALMLFETDLRPDLVKPAASGGRPRAKNNITTYMIGFADDFVQNDPLLVNTAQQGGGRFIAASDGPALERAFDSVISDAISLDAAAAAVAVTNAQIASGTVGYASSYVSGEWAGDLEAYALDITTGLQSGAAQWKARDKLNAQVAASGGHLNRKIVTSTGSNGTPFTTANASSFRGGVSSLTDAVVDYTRGSRTGEGTSYRQRNNILGDIINAEPVVVNYAGNPVVYQAANDGMLHVFDGRIGVTSGGTELWAYVPKLVHAKLAGRAAVSSFQHEYLVDGTPAVADVTGVTVSGNAVSKILVGGLGKGGAGYYALDVSTGTAATEAVAAGKVLWEFKDANGGYSFGTPLIVNTAAGWRVVVASGYRNDTNTDGLGGDGRGRVWVLDPADGSVQKTFVTPTGFGSGTDPLGLAFLSRPQNLTGDSVVRYVYGGDLKGNVWRVDLNAANNSTLVQIAAVTDGSGVAQPISSPPVVGPVAGSSSKYLVYFGTGQYFSVDDVPGTSSPNAWSSQKQTLYGIVDDTSVASPTLPNIRGTNGATCPTNPGRAGGDGDLVCQQATTTSMTHHPVDLSTKRGFYVDIPVAGGRVNTQGALTSGGTLVMIVNVPTNAQCDPGGSSYLFQLSGATGGAIVKTYGGADYFASMFLIGNALSSRPVIVVTSTGPRALLRMSDKGTESLSISETAGSAPSLRRIYMRPIQ